MSILTVSPAAKDVFSVTAIMFIGGDLPTCPRAGWPTASDFGGLRSGHEFWRRRLPALAPTPAAVPEELAASALVPPGFDSGAEPDREHSQMPLCGVNS
jgi:hypothetical protein